MRLPNELGSAACQLILTLIGSTEIRRLQEVKPVCMRLNLCGTRATLALTAGNNTLSARGALTECRAVTRRSPNLAVWGVLQGPGVTTIFR